MTREKVLAIIPARSGSKRLRNKNIRSFSGKPLIAYSIKAARQCNFIDRIIVDTDSKKIAEIARSYGAAVPFLRPARLASDSSQLADCLIYLLKALERKEGYLPTHLVILQATSPLRSVADIKKCWQMITTTNATTVLTIAPAQSRLYNLDKEGYLVLANSGPRSTNSQDWKRGYTLNGGVYIIKTPAFLKERRIITRSTKAVVCDAWRSIDIDTADDFAISELLFRSKTIIRRKINGLSLSQNNLAVGRPKRRRGGSMVKLKN